MNNQLITRRSLLRAAAAGAFCAMASPILSAAPTAGAGKRILIFTRSQDFPHAVITRKGDELAFAEKILHDLATAAGYDVLITKDGTLLSPENIAKYDGFVFYTTGDLTQPPGTKYKSDQTPAMSAEGKTALLAAIAGGKGFLGLHCASDTFHSKKRDFIMRPNPAPDTIDPYIAMLGGEFLAHGSQQNATIHVASHDFPGLEDLADFSFTEEWYSLFNFAPDLHVILVQETQTMLVNGQRQWQYQRPPYPDTWARKHGDGRVFYTAMGHREDVWTNPLYQKIILSSLAWITKATDFDLQPNLKSACPELLQQASTRGE
jgi:type 1 glutamine amidotransferase